MRVSIRVNLRPVFPLGMNLRLKKSFTSSLPLKALEIVCSLKQKGVARIGDKFHFPPSVSLRIPLRMNRACSHGLEEVCFYEAIFISGLCFLIHPFISELSHLNLAPGQLVPNSWRMVICCMVLWLSANDKDIIRVDEFFHLYHLRPSTHSGYWEFKPWDAKSRLAFDSPSSLHE